MALSAPCADDGSSDTSTLEAIGGLRLATSLKHFWFIIGSSVVVARLVLVLAML